MSLSIDKYFEDDSSSSCIVNNDFAIGAILRQAKNSKGLARLKSPHALFITRRGQFLLFGEVIA